jgi:hypothetical protein
MLSSPLALAGAIVDAQTTSQKIGVNKNMHNNHLESPLLTQKLAIS